MYIAGNRKFKTLKDAIAYAEKVFVKTGDVLGIEQVVKINPTPGYVAYIAKGYKL
jgi:hypothetical protein